VRKDLLNFNLLSRKVFINSAGSMRTRPTGAAAHAEVRILSVGLLFRRCSCQDSKKGLPEVAASGLWECNGRRLCGAPHDSRCCRRIQNIVVLKVTE
jgi:hypothetical protein